MSNDSNVTRIKNKDFVKTEGFIVATVITDLVLSGTIDFVNYGEMIAHPDSDVRSVTYDFTKIGKPETLLALNFAHSMRRLIMGEVNALTIINLPGCDVNTLSNHDCATLEKGDGVQWTREELDKVVDLVMKLAGVEKCTAPRRPTFTALNLVSRWMIEMPNPGGGDSSVMYRYEINNVNFSTNELLEMRQAFSGEQYPESLKKQIDEALAAHGVK